MGFFFKWWIFFGGMKVFWVQQWTDCPGNQQGRVHLNRFQKLFRCLQQSPLMWFTAMRLINIRDFFWQIFTQSYFAFPKNVTLSLGYSISELSSNCWSAFLVIRLSVCLSLSLSLWEEAGIKSCWDRGWREKRESCGQRGSERGMQTFVWGWPR